MLLYLLIIVEYASSNSKRTHDDGFEPPTTRMGTDRHLANAESGIPIAARSDLNAGHGKFGDQAYEDFVIHE